MKNSRAPSRARLYLLRGLLRAPRRHLRHPDVHIEENGAVPGVLAYSCLRLHAVPATLVDSAMDVTTDAEQGVPGGVDRLGRFIVGLDVRLSRQGQLRLGRRQSTSRAHQHAVREGAVHGQRPYIASLRVVAEVVGRLYDRGQ